MILVWLKSGERAASRCRSFQQYLSENVKLTCPITSREFHSIQSKRIQNGEQQKQEEHNTREEKTQNQGLVNQLNSHHNPRYNTLKLRHDKMSNRTFREYLFDSKVRRETMKEQILFSKARCNLAEIILFKSSHGYPSEMIHCTLQRADII